MTFGIEFEKQLLATLISNPKYTSRCKFIDDKYFTLPEMNFIWAATSYYSKNANCKINDMLLKQCIDDTKGIDEEVKFRIIKINEELKDVYKTQVAGSDKALVFKARQFFEAKNVKRNIDELKKWSDLGDHEKASKILKKIKFNDGTETDFDNYEIIDWHDSIKERLSVSKKLKESGIIPISTGFLALDKLMKGGYAEGDLFSIIAATNVGKSALATHICGQNADQGIGTIMFATEMHAYRMAMRLDARHTFVDFERFKNYEFDSREEKRIIQYYEDCAQKYSNLIKIVSVKRTSETGTKNHGISFDFIRNTIDDLRHQVKNFRCAIFDCAGHIDPGEKVRDEKERLAKIAWQLDGYLEQEALAGVATWQTNRGGANNADNESVGGAYEIAQCSDWVLGINKVETLPSPKEKHEIPDEEIYEGGIEDLIMNHNDDLNARSFDLALTKAREGCPGKVPVSAMLNRMFYYEQNMISGERNSII